MNRTIVKFISFILTLCMMLSFFNGISSIPVFATNFDNIRAIAKDYINSNGNDSTLSGLLEAVQEFSPDATLVSEDYFIYHAVDGVYDEDPDIKDRLSIPGHDGYVSAIFTVGTERISVIETIPHEEENLGVLTKISTSDVNASDVFNISNNNLLGIKEAATEYQKIVIDSNIVHISGFNYTSFVSKAQVLILRNSGAYGGTDTTNGGMFRSLNGKGFISLKAVYMDDSIKDGTYFSGRNTTNNDFFPMPTLKYFRFPENGTTFDTNYRDFFAHANYGTSLENVNTHVLGTLHSNSFLSCTSLYSVYLGENTTGTSFDGGPATRVKMTYEDQQTATFARAAVLAKQAIDSALSNGANTDKIIKSVKASYVGKIDGVSVENLELGDSGDFGINNQIILTHNSDIFKFEINKSKALVDLNTDISITPQFDPLISEYSAMVSSSKKSIELNAVATEGANIESIIGNTNLSVGTNIIEINVKNTDGKIVTYKITVYCSGVLSGEAWKAAENYVQSNQNGITPDGLLAAVNTVLGTATLPDKNFFIKHSVNAAKDTDYVSGYPLDIKGTDGSVTAIFEYNGGYFTFNSVFGHETETIKVKTYAIVGDANYSDYFGYDENGNVVELKKAVDKIILPEGYSGTVCSLSGDNESMMYSDSVKVLIINNTASLKNAAFAGWKNLTAVQFGNNDFILVESWNTHKSQFANCSKLRFVKLPDRLQSNWGQHLSVQMFYNCVSLENLNIPEFSTGNKFISSWAFGYTRIRDFFLTKNVGINSNESDHEITYHSIKETGTGNLIYYSDDMTLVRATALIGAGAYRFNSPSEEGIIESAKEAITGSHDSIEFAEKLTYSWQEKQSTPTKLNGVLTVSDGIYDVEIPISCSKTILALSVDGYDFTEQFDADQLKYEISVPINTKKICVNCVAAEGAEVEVKGTEISKSGKVTVDVITDGNKISYEIKVNWNYDFDSESLLVLRKTLLGANKCEADINKDNHFDIRDLVHLKKRIVNFVDGYNDFGDDVIKLESTWEGLTADELKYVVSYLENGQIKDVLFDGIALTPPKNFLFSYSGTDGNLARLTKRDWSNFINNNLFAYGVNVDALDEVVGEVKDALRLDGYRYDVYLPIIYPVQSLENWGLLNGETMNFTSGSDNRISAMKWFVDEEIRLFNERNYSNLRLRGFYYAHESMKNGDLDIIPAITDYVRQNGMITIWTPYYDANGYQYWEDYGIDKATLQINYFGEGSGLPNAGPISNIKDAAQRANDYKTGIEMELSSLNSDGIAVLKEYFRGGTGYYKGTFQIFPKNPYQDKFHTWWLAYDLEAIKYMYSAKDSYTRSAYTEMYKFIKNTLSYNDIVF